MSNMNDFVIENGVLKRYLGPDGDVEIPDGVTCIGFQAFLACRTYKGYGPMKVTIPDGVTSVETGAFEACDCLTSITIPDSVTSIGGAAFRNCKRLKYITIPGSVLSIGDSAFFGCKTLMNVILQEGITKIGKFAFEDCFALKEIAVPKSVTELGACAFHYSANVLLPAGLTLQYFWIENETLKKYTGPEGDVIIPEGVSRIDDEAFAPFNAFVEERQPFCVTLPASLKKIENHAFRSSRVSGFQADDSSTVFKSENGMLLSKNGKRLIAYPAVIVSEPNVIPDSVETIAGYALSNVCYLKDPIVWINIPQNVQKIAKTAFPKYDVYAFISNKDLIEAVPNPIYLGDLKNVAGKNKNKVVKTFLFALNAGRPEIEPYKTSYADYIRDHAKRYIKTTYSSETVFRYFLREKLVSEELIEDLLGELEKRNRTDLKAELLEYRQMNLCQKEEDPFSLLESEAEMKRRLQMEQRREEIKDQKGIKGIVFVVTGELKHFGKWNPYTHSVDFNDLKWFIQNRDGFLRSAVGSKTDYLICNDLGSDSTKMKKAKELGVTIIDEETFLKMAEEG